MGGLLDISLEGRTGVVTGGASGIGLAICRALAGAGAAVVIADLNQEAGERAAGEIVDHGGQASFEQVDVADVKQVRRLMANVRRRHGGPDILVNNAGLQYMAPITEYPEDKWDLLIGVILKGAFLCTKYAMPAMIERKWGRIINMSSIHGRVASAYKCAYVSAKFGLIGLTREAALEAAPHGITVNAICPTYVRTPIVERQIASQAKLHGISEDEVLERIMLADAPIKRILEPSEVAALALFLCSDAAAGMTGGDIPIDCGWTAH